jgi:hypothetical protein
MKSFPRMLSMDVHVKTVNILPLAKDARKGVDSVCDEIVSSYAQSAIKSFSTYAQHAHSIIFDNYLTIPNSNSNFDYK